MAGGPDQPEIQGHVQGALSGSPDFPDEETIIKTQQAGTNY